MVMNFKYAKRHLGYALRRLEGLRDVVGDLNTMCSDYEFEIGDYGIDGFRERVGMEQLGQFEDRFNKLSELVDSEGEGILGDLMEVLDRIESFLNMVKG